MTKPPRKDPLHRIALAVFQVFLGAGFMFCADAFFLPSIAAFGLVLDFFDVELPKYSPAGLALMSTLFGFGVLQLLWGLPALLLATILCRGWLMLGLVGAMAFTALVNLIWWNTFTISW